MLQGILPEYIAPFIVTTHGNWGGNIVHPKQIRAGLNIAEPVQSGRART